MQTVVLTAHVLLVLALIVVVLLQRSEGGALGMGGGGGGFITGRGAANVLTRTTSVLAFLFFSTSLGLAIFSKPATSEQEIIRDLTGEEVRDPNTPATAEDLLETLGGGRAAPTEPAPAVAPEAVDASGSPAQDAPDAAPETETPPAEDQPE